LEVSYFFVVIFHYVSLKLFSVSSYTETAESNFSADI
jgi:hypothetical protein